MEFVCTKINENLAAIKKEKSKKQTNGFLPHSRTFPVIKEEVEKEEEEAEFFRIQPDSPLTSLYCGTRWKNRTWPDFLYEQAFAVNYYGIYEIALQLLLKALSHRVTLSNLEYSY